ncbi:MAG: glycosyltransferase family 2 protein [Clostridia bacterium]|nr:glycosyltransferase family 2 protein [Clostridia bacterium]
MDVVLIPAYQPDNALVEIVNYLNDCNFEIVVVDDGSGSDYKDIFSAISEKSHIVTLQKNRGKGAALKAGMRYIRDSLPDCENFITCDADGQHRPCDVVRVRNLLHKGNKFVLTVRERKGKIPFRSRIGNDLSKVVYTLLTNKYLSDNQSGLRGFSRSNLDWLIDVKKNNYDYEMNVLYCAAKMGLKITTMPIEAIYIEDNASSHFNPIVDTARIYKSLFSLAFGTMLSFVLVEILMLTSSLILGNNCLGFVIPSVGALGLLANILLNKYVFLKSIPAENYFTTIFYTIIYYFVYTLMCSLFSYAYPELSLFANFNIAYFICLPLKFFLHQIIFLASLSKE